MSNAPRRPRTAGGSRSTRKPAGPQPQAQPFDLDTLERDGDPGEFRFTLAGAEYILLDPFETEWDETEAINQLVMTGDNVGLMKRLLGPQFDDFAKQHVPVWKLGKLAEAWAVHYGLGEETA